MTVEYTDTVKVAVLGLYRSGSTALAGTLHCLGVDMGAPFFENYYEPDDLSRILRKWWDEPRLVPAVSAAKRVEGLTKWIKKREQSMASHIGAKHPLLSLCGPEVLVAWGAKTRFIWSHRQLESSINSLVRLGWWQGKEEFVQRTLWQGVSEFCAAHEHLRIDYSDMLANPRREIERAAEFIGIRPSREQWEQAIQSIKPEKRTS